MGPAKRSSTIEPVIGLETERGAGLSPHFIRGKPLPFNTISSLVFGCL